MRISDWSSDVCSSDLLDLRRQAVAERLLALDLPPQQRLRRLELGDVADHREHDPETASGRGMQQGTQLAAQQGRAVEADADRAPAHRRIRLPAAAPVGRSEEHTSELQPLMRISYAFFCLKKKN